jgi:hypothetical protein
MVERPFPQGQKQLCDLAASSADVLENFRTLCGSLDCVGAGTMECLLRSGGRLGVAKVDGVRDIRLSIRDRGPGIPAEE